jgi:hypothetical protein
MRQPELKLRRWCPDCQWHCDLDFDVQCPAQECSRRMRKRWMLVCSVQDCQQGYFTLEDFEAHECCSAY